MNEFFDRIRDFFAGLEEETSRAVRSFGGRRAAPSRRADEEIVTRTRRDFRNTEGRQRRFGDDAAVVTAEQDDDVSTVIGQIDTADALDVILVVPRNVRALRNAGAWPHIAAHARRYGIELGVVSTRGDVRSYAAENGLHTARTQRGLNSGDYYLKVGDREVIVPPVPWGGIVRGGMILSFLVAAFIVGCYQVPSAEVRLVPASQARSASGDARANAVIGRSDVETQTIAASILRRQFSTAVTTTTTGEVEVGDQAAVVTLQFTNGSSNTIQLPAGTRAQTGEGIAFLTDEALDVPPDSVPATITATAEEPGIEGNVPAATVLVLPDQGPALEVTNPEPGQSGTNKLTAAVSQEDVDRVRSIADDVLDGIALTFLQRAVEDEELGTMLDSSVNAAILAEEPLQRLDEPSDVLVMQYTLIASTLLVTQEQANEYGEILIRESLEPGTALLPGTVESAVTPTTVGGSRVRIVATGRVADVNEIAAIAPELVGMSRSDAERLLTERLALDQPPEIRISPDFIPWTWLPRRAERIKIVVTGPQAEEDEDTSDATPTESPTVTVTVGTATPTATADGGSGG